MRKILSPTGTRRPSTVSAASAKAMSVATGTAQPRSAARSAWLKATKTSAGTIMPPSAPKAGAAARARDASAPSVSSRRISSATVRKKIAIMASFTAVAAGSVITRPGTTIPTGRARSVS